MRSCPESSVWATFLPLPASSSPQRRKPFYTRARYFFACAEIIFAPYLSISACVIEVQHVNENFPAFFMLTILCCQRFPCNIRGWVIIRFSPSLEHFCLITGDKWEGKIKPRGERHFVVRSTVRFRKHFVDKVNMKTFEMAGF